MSDVNDLCLWHRLRMATVEKVSCGCQEWAVCVGDAIGRQITRKYYNRWDMPVQDVAHLYCCGSCQNRDAETHRCGDMLVCGDCLKQHVKAEPL